MHIRIIAQSNLISFKDMSQRLRLAGNTESNLTGPNLIMNLRPPTLETSRFPLNQLAGHRQ